MNSITERLVAVENQQGVSLNFIGSLMWHSISDCRIDRDGVSELFQKTGIDLKYLPKPINYRDAFRRATKAAEVNRVPIEKGKYLNLLVREVKMSKEEMIRTITREVVDGKNERLEYTEIIKLRLTGNELNVEPSMMATLDDIEQANRVFACYQENMEYYEGTNMRALVKDMLRHCSPVSVRPSGGVYFIPAEYEVFAQAIKCFIDELEWFNISTSGRSQAWMIPVVDTQKQRDMVSQSLETQVMSESESLIKEMADLIKNNKPFRQKTAQGYVERVRELKVMVAKYEEKLEFQATAAKSALELAMQQAVVLLEKGE